MKYQYQDYQNVLAQIQKETDFKPLIGVVLGSGLNGLLDQVRIVKTISYRDLEKMPVSTNKMHHGRFVFGYYQNVPILFMDGRLHCYEGYTSEEATFPIRIMGMLGIKYLLLTNAAGGMGKGYKPGDIMVIKDHIATFMESPLRGMNIEEFGTRFPDMSDVYNQDLSMKLVQKAREKNLPVQYGVFCQFPGPQYETKAEIRMAQILGADAAGMSTAIEAIVSNHMSIKTIGLSLITNYACGISDEKLSDEDVLKVAKKSSRDMESMFSLVIETLIEDHYDR